MKLTMKLMLCLSILFFGIGGISVCAEEPAPTEPEVVEPTPEVVEPTPTPEEEIVPEKEFDLGEFLLQYFPPEVVTTILGVLSAFISVIVLMFKLHNERKKSKGIETKTIVDIENLIQSILQDSVAQLLSPVFTKIDNLGKINTQFAKILALAQTNTPESKIAILDLIQGLNVIDEEVIETAKENVNKEAEEEQIKKAEKEKRLEEIANKPVE